MDYPFARMTASGAMALLIAMGLLGSPAMASVFDGFEDGDITANPAWFDANPGYGSGAVVPDPVRPSNLVWKAQGTASGADRSIATTDFAPMSWVGFHISVEIFSSGRFYGADMAVVDSWQGWAQGNGEGFQVATDDGARYGPNRYTRLQIGELSLTGWVHHSQDWDSSEAPPNEWRQVNLWHDPTTGLIKADLRRLSDGHVYVETSIVPMSFGESPLTLLNLGAAGPGGAHWNYLDNPTLVPEPASVLLFVLGGMAVMRKRSRQ